jgi:hypothetical protein
MIKCLLGHRKRRSAADSFIRKNKKLGKRQRPKLLRKKK